MYVQYLKNSSISRQDVQIGGMNTGKTMQYTNYPPTLFHSKHIELWNRVGGVVGILGCLSDIHSPNLQSCT